jgi:lipid-A-disaccharide synthase
MILAGEASGDAHAAEFVAQIQQIRPDVYLSGMGSEEMKKAGVDVFFDSSIIAVMGIIEVLKHWGDIKRAMSIVKQAMEQTKPDLLILVDYPEFNLKMARHAKSLGIKVLFYISPQVWAWRPKRIHKIGRLIDHMAVILKFEEPYYRKANIPVTFVGHPLVDKVIPTIPRDQKRRQLGLEGNQPVIGLFPGSRNIEIERLLPLMLETAASMLARDSNLRFVMPVANSLDYDAVQRQCEQSSAEIVLTRDDIYSLIPCCDAIVSCSGTVTLEVAQLGVPLCIIYKMSWLSYLIMSRLITIPYVGLANIVANQSIVREFLQENASVANISAEIFRLLEDNDYRNTMIQNMRLVRENLGEGAGSENMAKLALSFLHD